MSWTRLMKRTAKISVNALKFITTLLSVGKINKINPKINPTNEMINKVATKIVIVVMMFFFNC